jgi:hypothetical protein
MRMYRKPKSFTEWFFNLIRPLFVKGIDPNEDYFCVICNRPVLKRYFCCSDKCYDDAVKKGIF